MFLAGCRHRQKVFLDFIRRIRYNSYVVDMCRCVGMADEGDSKSLVLITRVGSTPTTGIKRKSSSLSGGLSFYLRRVSGSNSTTLHSRGSNQPCGLLLSARETPTTGIKRKPSSLSGGLPFYLRRVSGSNSTTLHSRGSNQPCGLLLSARETPTTGSIGPKPPHSKSLSFDAFHPAPNLIPQHKSPATRM